MKYRDKTLPIRDVSFWEPKLIGHQKVQVLMVYEIEGPDTQTSVRQPIEFSFCAMRQMGGEFHRLLNELEDKLQEARAHMQGDR